MPKKQTRKPDDQVERPLEIFKELRHRRARIELIDDELGRIAGNVKDLKAERVLLVASVLDAFRPLPLFDENEND